MYIRISQSCNRKLDLFVMKVLPGAAPSCSGMLHLINSTLYVVCTSRKWRSYFNERKILITFASAKDINPVRARAKMASGAIIM